MTESTDLTKSSLEDWTTKMTEALNKAHTSSHPSYSPAAPIGIKLDDSNYALWSQVVEMYISGKDKLGYNNYQGMAGQLYGFYLDR